MIIYTNQKSKKKSQNTKKKQELKASWDKLMEKWDVKPSKQSSGKSNGAFVYKSPTIPDYRRTVFDDIGSIDTGVGNTSKKESPQYSGDAMLGIGQLHKSNAVPVFKQEDAEDIARMRR